MRFRTLLYIATLAAGGLLVVPLGGQSSSFDLSLLSGLTLRAIGPTSVGGRVDDFAVGRVAGQPDAVYVASASGGVFKSVNGGVSWAPVFDRVDGMMSIGAIAVAKSNPNIVWVGTGEANTRQSSSWGDGVYKSVDAGKTWRHLGLEDTRSINRIVIDPANPDVVFVAAAGHLWGPNADRGVFKTTDGGATWKKTLFVDEHTGANDIIMEPGNARVLYASTYQHERKSWGFNGGGPGSGIYKSTDAGNSWRKLTNGLPAGDKGRIGMDIYKGDGTIVYAIVEAPTGGAGRGGAGRGGGGAAQPAPANQPPSEAGLYRSVDGGEHWEHLSPLNTRPNYYSQIRVDPKDRNRLYELGSNRGFFVSDDGGRTFKDIFQNSPGQSLIHGEDHALWVDPADPSHLIIGGDGGVSISWDRGLSWDFRNNIPLAQFYEIDVDNKVPFTVCGGLQDNGEWCLPSSVRDRNGIANRDSWNIGGGDGFYVKFDRSDENFAYAESQNGNASRVNLTTLERTPARPGGGRGGGGGGAEAGGQQAPALRFNWDTPIEVSRFGPTVVYMGAQMLFRSADHGATWTAISPDLTAGIDPATLPIMGAPVPPNALSRNDGTSPFGSLTSIGESPIDARVIYTGAQDGTVQVTRDGGTSWTNVTARIPGLPPYTYCSTVLPSRYAPGRVYATFDGHYSDDYRPYVYVSDDFGQTWRAIAAGLPETGVNRIREHPSDPHFLVLAHERGVHFSTDDGRTWIPLALATNFPPVPSDDLVIHPRDNSLVIGTHGRGIWILDDVGPLELLSAETLQSEAAMAPIAPAHEIITHTVQAWYGAGEFFAPNRDYDAGITYYLRAAASGSAQIEITDVYGTHVRTLQGPAARGLNRVAWNLRGDPPTSNLGPGPAGGGAGGRGGGGGGRGGAQNLGPLVAPGRYVIVVKVPGVSRELRGTVMVGADPIAGGR
ncbi:MAG TPA: hypothetical protein VLT86_17670 [Vicinamibacterales bacterium]|nr:hypothetical protein [Vicinamibacterales bacterium]